MSRAKNVEAPLEIDEIVAAVGQRRVSHLENRYGQFYERTIDANGSAGRLMTQMNSIYTVLSGLGAVMRIVAGNPVLEDAFDSDDLTSEPPLSNGTISQLTNMTAAICEMIADDIDSTAVSFNDRGRA